MFGFETKREKELRLKLLDLQNKIARDEARRKGKPFFGTKYTDDYR